MTWKRIAVGLPLLIRGGCPSERRPVIVRDSVSLSEDSERQKSIRVFILTDVTPSWLVGKSVSLGRPEVDVELRVVAQTTSWLRISHRESLYILGCLFGESHNAPRLLLQVIELQNFGIQEG